MAKAKYTNIGDNVDTDVIIPARYLNTADHKELAAHCMEDIDTDFVQQGKARRHHGRPAGTSAAAPPGSTRPSPSRPAASPA